MGTSPQVPVPVLLSLDSPLLNISVTRKVRMCSSSLTTSSDSLRLVLKYLPFSAVSPLLWVTSQPLPPTWVACRSVSPPPRRDPSPPCRPSTCQLTTRQILPLPPHSLTWTPPLSCPDLLLNVESTPLWIPLIPPAVSWTPTLLDTSTTTLPEVSRRSSRTTSLSRTSLLFLVWMSCLRKTSSRLPEPGRSRDSSPSPSRLLRSSPATPASSSPFPRPSLDSKRSWLASSTTCQRLLSTWLATLMRLLLRPTASQLRELPQNRFDVFTGRTILA